MVTVVNSTIARMREKVEKPIWYGFTRWPMHSHWSICWWLKSRRETDKKKTIFKRKFNAKSWHLMNSTEANCAPWSVWPHADKNAQEKHKYLIIARTHHVIMMLNKKRWNQVKKHWIEFTFMSKNVNERTIFFAVDLAGSLACVCLFLDLLIRSTFVHKFNLKCGKNSITWCAPNDVKITRHE